MSDTYPTLRAAILGNPPGKKTPVDKRLLLRALEQLAITAGLNGRSIWSDFKSQLDEIAGSADDIGIVVKGDFPGTYRWVDEAWVKVSDLPAGFAALDLGALAGLDEVALTDIVDIFGASFVGRPLGSGTGAPQVMTAEVARTILNVADGATANASDADLRDRSTHTGAQAISTVDGLQGALDGKAADDHGHAIADVTGLQGALDNKTAVGHNHPISAVTGLQDALDGKAADDHGHAIADVTGLQGALDGIGDDLDGKVDDLTLTQVTNFGALALLVTGGSANNITATVPAPLAIMTFGTGSHVAIQAPGTNTGPVTLAIAGHLAGEAKPVRRADGTNLASGDVRADQAYILRQYSMPDVHWRIVSGGALTAMQRAALDNLASDLAALQASFTAGLDALAQSKANTTHPHPIGHVTGLDAALAGKLDASARDGMAVGQEPSPGYHPERFARAASGVGRYTQADTVQTSEGRALRIIGPATVVSAPAKQIGPQDVDEVRIRVQRPSPVVDPASDAVAMGVVCYDSAGNPIQTVWLGEIETTAMGAKGATAFRRMRISRAPGLAELALPSNTRSYTVTVQTWGGVASRLDILDAERHTVLDGTMSFGGVPLDGWGTLAERAQYDDEEEGFLFAQTDGDWKLWLRDDSAEGGWEGPQLVRGPQGETPQILPALNDIANGRRRSMMMVSIADTQPQYGDTNMQPGQENAQLAYQQELFDEIGRNWGDKAFGWIVHGDVVQRAAAGVSEINKAETGPHAFLTPGTLTPGDPYPWGYHVWFEQAWKYGRTAIDRIWACTGNHDIDHRGILTSPRANRFSYFEEAFGKLHYHVIIGNIGFLFLSDQAGTVGGQIPNTAIDWADDLLASTSRDIKWHLSVHHPLADWTPVGSRIVIRDPITITQGMVDAQAADFDANLGFGEVTIDIGAYEAPSEILTEIWLGAVGTGERLRNGVDYRYEAPPLEEPADDDDDGDAPDDPQLSVIHVRRPLEPGQTLQVRTVNSIRSSLDLPSTDRLNALLTKYQDRIYAYLYGHTGNMADAGQDHTVYDSGRGIWFVGHNLSIPGVTRPGLPVDPLGARPSIYTIMEWDVDTNTCTARRWNSDAEDWLKNTHPENGAADYTITYDGQIDLGDGDVSFDGRWKDGTGAVMRRNTVTIVRDVSETPGRQERLSEPPNPSRPNRLHRNVGEPLVFHRDVLEAASRWSLRAGDGVARQTWMPVRRTDKFLNQVSLFSRGDASALAFEELTLRSRGANSNATARRTWRGLNNAGVMQDIMSLDGRYNAIVAHGRVGEPIQTTGRIDQGHVMLLCKADAPGVRFDGRITGARRESTTTVNTSQFWIDIEHSVGANRTHTTRWRSSEGTSGQRIVPVYFQIDGDPDGTLYLGLMNNSGATGAPLRFSSANFWGERPQDEPLVWRIVRPVGWEPAPPKNLLVDTEGFESWLYDAPGEIEPLGNGRARFSGFDAGAVIASGDELIEAGDFTALSLEYRSGRGFVGRIAIQSHADHTDDDARGVVIEIDADGTPVVDSVIEGDGAATPYLLRTHTDRWRIGVTHDGPDARMYLRFIDAMDATATELGRAMSEDAEAIDAAPTTYQANEDVDTFEDVTAPEVEPENPDDEPFDPSGILIASMVMPTSAHAQNDAVRYRYSAPIVAPALIGPKLNAGVNVNNLGVAEVNAEYGPHVIEQNGILLLCRARDPGTVFWGTIRSARNPLSTSTANTSAFAYTLQHVVANNGSRLPVDIWLQADDRDRTRLVQCRVGGVDFLGLQNISPDTGSPIRNGRMVFTGTRTPDVLGFTPVTLGELDEWGAEDSPDGAIYDGLSTGDPVVDAFDKSADYGVPQHRINGATVLTSATPITPPGPFADDAAADAGGVPVGAIYRATGGDVKWRQA